MDLIQDDDRLREERKKAKKNKDKYIGVEGSGGYGGGYKYSKFIGIQKVLVYRENLCKGGEQSFCQLTVDVCNCS